MTAMTSYLENKLVDHVFRGVPYTPPATLYVALLLAAPTDDSSLVEATGGGYARVPVSSSTINWSGTQGAGSTTASSGTSGTTSNNSPIIFGIPTSAWGQIAGVAVMDAAVGGNALIQGTLPQTVTVNSDSPAPRISTGAFEYQIDN